MKGRSIFRRKRREGAVGASIRETEREGRPRAAGLNRSKLCRFPREGAGRFSGWRASERANMGGTAEHGSVP